MASADFATIRTPPNLSSELAHPRTPWHISPSLFRRIKEMPSAERAAYKKCAVLPEDPEWNFVWKSFHHQQSSKYAIKRIYCIHQSNLTTAFESSIANQESEAEKYKPKWEAKPHADLRRRVIQRWEHFSSYYSPVYIEGRGTFEKVKVLPLWHGSEEWKCNSICETGFTFFGKHDEAEGIRTGLSTDVGFFGSGMYFTTSAAYAADIYSRGHLLLAWVSMREPYPVVAEKKFPPGKPQDMTMLEAKGAVGDHNAHFIPVISIDATNPRCKVYYPCAPDENPAWDEFVAFQPNQPLTRFWVELQVNWPLTPATAPHLIGQLLDLIFNTMNHSKIQEDNELYEDLVNTAGVIQRIPEHTYLNATHNEFLQKLMALFDLRGNIDQKARRIFRETSASFLPAVNRAPTAHRQIIEIQQAIDSRDFLEAWNALIFLVSTFTATAEKALIVSAYRLLSQILATVPFKDKSVLFNKVVGPLLVYQVEEKDKFQLFWDLGRWFISHRERFSKENQIEESYVPALSYYMDALDSAERLELPEREHLYSQASTLLFEWLLKDLYPLQHWLDQSVNAQAADQVEEVVKQLLLIRNNFCQIRQERASLQPMFKKARDFCNAFSTSLPNLMRLIQEGLSEETPLATPVVKRYRERIKSFQREWLLGFQTVNQMDDSVLRTFQKEKTAALKNFFRDFCLVETEVFKMSSESIEWVLRGDSERDELTPYPVLEWTEIKQREAEALKRWESGLKLLLACLRISVCTQNKRNEKAGPPMAPLIQAIENYRKAWGVSFDEAVEIDLKKQYAEVLDELIRAVGTFCGKKQSNPQDILDALDETVLVAQSKQLLKEAIQDIYKMRVRLQLNMKSSKDRLSLKTESGFSLLSKKERNTLARIHWLVLCPLVASIEDIIQKERFTSISLIKKAYELLLQPNATEEAQSLKPFVNHLVCFWLENQTSQNMLRDIYTQLSTKTTLEPLRGEFLKILSHSPLCKELAAIPNRDGYRQSFRTAQLTLQASVQQLCTDQKPLLTELNVELEIPGLGVRQLKQELVKELIDLETGMINPYIGAKKEYDNCRHTVRSLAAYGLHIKESPDHPCMDYAVGSLMHRLFDHGPSATLLVKISVSKNGQKVRSYPVLFSRTVTGEIFEPKDVDKLDPIQLTEMLISQPLILPGDAQARNFIRQGAKLISIDNDVSLVDPIIKTSGAIKNRKIQFTSILFCLKKEIPLEKSALQKFCELDPLLILNGWLEDLVQREKMYAALFPDSAERKILLESDQDKSFTPFFILGPGAIVRLYEQFLKLQSFFRENAEKRLTSLDLLEQIIGRSDQARFKTTEVGFHIKKAYLNASSSSPSERLRQAVERDISQSMASGQAIEAQIGKIPLAKTLENRQAFSPEKALAELLAINAERCTELGMVLHTQGRATFKSAFHQMKKRNKPDLERQRLVLKSLLHILPKRTDALNLSYCNVLEDKELEEIIHKYPQLTKLDLRYCPRITAKAIRKIPACLHHLRELYLSGCQALDAIESVGIFRWPIVFNELQILHIEHCPKLTRLNLTAPRLTELKISDSPQLSIEALNTPKLEYFSSSQNTHVAKISLLNSLRHLQLSHCHSLTSDQLDALLTNNPHLTELHLIDCSALVQVNAAHAHLAIVHFQECGQLESISLESSHVQQFRARNCPRLRSLNMKSEQLKVLDLAESPQIQLGKERLFTYTSLEYLDLSLNKSLLRKEIEEIPVQLPFLKRLALNQCQQLGPSLTFQAPFEQLTHLSMESANLKTLTLSGKKLLELNLRNNPELTLGTVVLPELKSINLMNCAKVSLSSLPSQWHKAVSVAVTASNQLEELSTFLTSHSVEIDLEWHLEINALLKFLENAPQVFCRLTLKNTHIGVEGVERLLTAISRLDITQLIIFNAELSAKEIELLAAYLPQTQLTELCLDYNCIGDKGAEALAKALRKSRLLKLSLENNQIGSNGAKALAMHLIQSSITYLNLNNNQIETDGASTIASVLPSTKIIQLDLDGNAIDNEGLKAISEPLSRCKLRSLSLRDNTIDLQGISALCAQLPLSKIIKLSLSRNRIGNQEIKPLALALALSSVAELNLWGNLLDDEGAKILAAHLPRSKMNKVTLSDNPIGELGRRTLSQACENRVRLIF